MTKNTDKDIRNRLNEKQRELRLTLEWVTQKRDQLFREIGKRTYPGNHRLPELKLPSLAPNTEQAEPTSILLAGHEIDITKNGVQIDKEAWYNTEAGKAIMLHYRQSKPNPKEEPFFRIRETIKSAVEYSPKEVIWRKHLLSLHHPVLGYLSSLPENKLIELAKQPADAETYDFCRQLFGDTSAEALGALLCAPRESLSIVETMRQESDAELDEETLIEIGITAYQMKCDSVLDKERISKLLQSGKTPRQTCEIFSRELGIIKLKREISHAEFILKRI